MNTQEQIKPQPQKPYKQPKLTVFGDVHNLTQAGLGSKTEQNAGQGTTTKKPG